MNIYLTSGILVEAKTGKERLTSGAYLAIASGDPAKPPLAKITAPRFYNYLCVNDDFVAREKLMGLINKTQSRHVSILCEARKTKLIYFKSFEPIYLVPCIP
jgi:hypothetical protein